MLSVMAPILCMSMVFITIVVKNNSYSAAARILKYLQNSHYTYFYNSIDICGQYFKIFFSLINTLSYYARVFVSICG